MEEMLIEWFREGIWYGSDKTVFINAHREEAEKHLSSTPDRYYYVPNMNNRIRLSYKGY